MGDYQYKYDMSHSALNVLSALAGRNPSVGHVAFVWFLDFNVKKNVFSTLALAMVVPGWYA